MRFIHLYLVGYFLLVIGAGIALWQAGAATRVPGEWLALAALVAAVLGVLLVVTSSRRPVAHD